MTKLTVTCADWRPLRRNTLRGFARVRVVELDLTIHDVAIHEKNGRTWAATALEAMDPGRPTRHRQFRQDPIFADHRV